MNRLPLSLAAAAVGTGLLWIGAAPATPLVWVVVRPAVLGVWECYAGVYLTMVTFASAGYGDVLPGTAVGKLLMMLTAAAGLLCATILFAALFQALREE